MRLMYRRPLLLNGGETLWFILFLLVSTTAARWSEAGPLVRQGNSTLQMPAAPPASAGTFQYQTVETLNGLAFDKPVFATSPPGDTSRLYVAERAGRIVVITNLAN